MQKEKPLSKMNKHELIDHLDTFTRAYLVCALWSSNDNADEQGGEHLYSNYTIADITNPSLVRAIRDCEAFQKDNEKALKLYYKFWDEGQAGHDLWLTAQRHGTGFCDRRIQGNLEANRLMKPVLEWLTKASHKVSEESPYVYKGHIYLN